MNEPEGLAGKDFRIRQIVIKMIVDVYDNTGMLAERTATNEIVIPEAQFPTELINILSTQTNLGRGFAASRPATPPVPPK